MAINPVNRDSSGEEFRNRVAKRVVREYGSAFLDTRFQPELLDRGMNAFANPFKPFASGAVAHSSYFKGAHTLETYLTKTLVGQNINVLTTDVRGGLSFKALGYAGIGLLNLYTLSKEAVQKKDLGLFFKGAAKEIISWEAGNFLAGLCLAFLPAPLKVVALPVSIVANAAGSTLASRALDQLA
jgi:hypothetical protein